MPTGFPKTVTFKKKPSVLIALNALCDLSAGLNSSYPLKLYVCIIQ